VVAIPLAMRQPIVTFFESLFGQNFDSMQTGQSEHGFHTHGEDHHAKVLIELEDAYQGATRSITLRSPELDSNGRMAMEQRTLSVKIPKGVKQGQRIRLSGQGSSGYGKGQAGDLYLEIVFEPHSMYRVEGRDVYLDLPMTPWEIALGATVKVPTPNGPVDLKIPSGSSGGKTLRLKRRGIPGEPPGDLLVILQVTVPPADSDDAKILYQKMEQQLAYNPREKLGV